LLPLPLARRVATTAVPFVRTTIGKAHGRKQRPKQRPEQRQVPTGMLTRTAMAMKVVATMTPLIIQRVAVIMVAVVAVAGN